MMERESPQIQALKAAAEWIVSQSELPHPVIPALRTKFNISASEAARACTLANSYRRAQD
jgi:hypothetical protein